MDSNSYYVLDGYLCVITSETNPCDYQVSSDFIDFYCSGTYSVSGLLKLPLNSTSNKATSTIFTPIYPTDFSVSWTKNGTIVSDNSSLSLSQSGLYKFTIKQGTCEQSISKNVTVAPSLTTPTFVSVAPNNICVGNNAILSGSCATGTLKWYSESSLMNEVSSSVRPSTTTNYYGVCSYNTCKSTSATASVMVSQTPPATPSFFNSFTGFVCQSAGNRTYEIASIPQAFGYEWSYTGNGVSVSSQGTQAVLNFSPTASSGNVRVRSVGACGASNYLSGGVEVIPLTIRMNDRREFGTGTRNTYRAGKAIELLPSATTSINITNGAIFKAEVITCPN